MPSIILDSFDRADNATSLGSTDTGEAWVPQPRLVGSGNTFSGVGATSVLGILSNQAYTTVAITEPATGFSAWTRQIATIDHGFANADLSVDVVLPFNKGSFGGLTFRHDPSASGNLWQFMVYRSIVGSGYHTYLELIDTGGTSRPYAASQSVLSDGATGTYRIRLLAIGTRLRGYFDGVLQHDVVNAYTSTYQTSMLHGISIQGSTPRLDNYRGAPALVFPPLYVPFKDRLRHVRESD